MKRTTFTQLFIRSCLESSPVHGDLGHGQSAWGGCDLSLHHLKQRLLLLMLERTSDPGLGKRLCAAANQAAELAWETDHPLLVFPLLFEELAAAVRAKAAQVSPHLALALSNRALVARWGAAA